MKLLSPIRQALAAALVGCGLFGIIAGPAAALTNPPNFAPTLYPSQQTHYIRITIPFNACTFVALTCSFKAGAVPYNSFMANGWLQVLTTATGATALTAAVGTAPAGAQLVAATSILTAGNGSAVTMANLGETATGNGIAQTGGNGGFDIWVTLTATTAAPTAGLAVIILEFIAPNDGACTMVPMNTIAPGC